MLKINLESLFEKAKIKGGERSMRLFMIPGLMLTNLWIRILEGWALMVNGDECSLTQKYCWHPFSYSSWERMRVHHNNANIPEFAAGKLECVVDLMKNK